jgi:hypothetical protein
MRLVLGLCPELHAFEGFSSAPLHGASPFLFIFFACPKKTKQKKGHPLRRRFCSYHCKTSRPNLKAVQGFPPSLRLILLTLAAREDSTFASLRWTLFLLCRNNVHDILSFTVIYLSLLFTVQN